VVRPVPGCCAGGGADGRGHGWESAGVEGGYRSESTTFGALPGARDSNFVVLSGGKTVVQQAGLVDHQQMEQWLRSAASAQAAG